MYECGFENVFNFDTKEGFKKLRRGGLNINL